MPSKGGSAASYLTTSEKLALIRPLVLRYMLPLCAVYIEEYIINSVSSHTTPDRDTDNSTGRCPDSCIPVTHVRPLVLPLQDSPGLLSILVPYLYVLFSSKD